MTETYAPPEPDPRSVHFSPKGFEKKTENKITTDAIKPPNEIVEAVAAAARYLKLDQEKFADGIWADSEISVTREQREKILRANPPAEAKDSKS